MIPDERINYLNQQLNNIVCNVSASDEEIKYSIGQYIMSINENEAKLMLAHSIQYLNSVNKSSHPLEPKDSKIIPFKR